MVERSHKPSTLVPTQPLPQATVDVNPTTSRITATLPSGDTVTILLHGATVISWKSASGVENLWLSQKAILDGSKPVRGGIPLVFPVFGPPPKEHETGKLSQHGFARGSKWEYLGKSTSEAGEGGEGVKLDFGLSHEMLPAAVREQWPYKFGLTYSITLSQGRLQTMLHVRNVDERAFEFQMLLRSYFKVKDVSTVGVAGLMGTQYVDKVLNAQEFTEKSQAVRIAGEVDRVYKSIPQDTTSILEGETPRFDVVRDNLADTVVWNPWIEKSKGMGDFEPKDGYKEMVCVEVGAVDGWQRLEANDTFEAGQILKSLL